jgi:hypothetical protein
MTTKKTRYQQAIEDERKRSMIARIKRNAGSGPPGLSARLEGESDEDYNRRTADELQHKTDTAKFGEREANRRRFEKQAKAVIRKQDRLAEAEGQTSGAVLVVVRVDKETGEFTHAEMLRSTGDNVATIKILEAGAEVIARQLADKA